MYLMCIVDESFFYSLPPRSLISYCKNCCWAERRMSIIERQLHDRKEKWVLNIIGNILPWCRLHAVPTFDCHNSVAEASFFLGICGRTLERYISKFLVNGRVRPGPVSRSYGRIIFTPREELIVFAHQIWKPQFLSFVQSPFSDNCH